MDKIRRNLEGKKIAILGLGLENISLLNWLTKEKISAQITICDNRELGQLPTIKTQSVLWQVGKKAGQELERFDILFRSPGWPLHDNNLNRAKKLKKIITSPINLFFDLCPTKNIIGVTGTKGKGTTATLIYKILKAAKRPVFLGGNIGIAPFSFLSKIKPNDYVVLELSSFQLEDLVSSPKIAVLTNFYQEHLAPADPNNPNYHKNLTSYWQAKLKIATGLNNRWLVVNEKLRKKITASKLPTRITFFSTSSLESRLAGSYNQENIAAAIKVAEILKIPATTYRPAIKNFKNLEHRLELVTKKDGVSFYDNSFSTTPESTILDIESFTAPLILIAGGADKGANFNQLARTIKQGVKHLILLPGTGTNQILLELKKVKYSFLKLTEANSMLEAVSIAKSLAKSGDTVLLSTGCASFGIFKNYKERGSLFHKHVKSDTELSDGKNLNK